MAGPHDQGSKGGMGASARGLTGILYQGLSIHKLWYSEGSWNLSAGGYQGTITPILCIFKPMCIDVYVCMYTHIHFFSLDMGEQDNKNTTGE